MKAGGSTGRSRARVELTEKAESTTAEERRPLGGRAARGTEALVEEDARWIGK